MYLTTATSVTPCRIPAYEISFEATKASGPGGQNVNKRNTAVRLKWDMSASNALTPEEKAHVGRFAPIRKMLRDGELSLRSETARTYEGNRRDALDKLNKLIDLALKVQPERLEARKPAFIEIGRRRNKSHNSGKKAGRRKFRC